MSLLNLEGAHENVLATTGEFYAQAPRTVLTLPSGERVVLPTELLLQAREGQPDAGAAARDLALDTAEPRSSPTTEEPAVQVAGSASPEREMVIPLVREELIVGKTQVETERLRVRRETEEVAQTVSVPLTEVRWEVEHIPVEQVVETQPEIRQVGETIIFPLVEERLVVKRELWLREEVHVRKVTTTVEKSADFAVRRDVLVEERSSAQGDRP